jgi:hypothetical protein
VTEINWSTRKTTVQRAGPGNESEFDAKDTIAAFGAAALLFISLSVSAITLERFRIFEFGFL